MLILGDTNETNFQESLNDEITCLFSDQRENNSVDGEHLVNCLALSFSFSVYFMKRSDPDP